MSSSTAPPLPLARPTPAPERVQACIELLNTGVRERRVPPYWLERINPDTLDITSPVNCAFGQIWGSFPDGLAALDIAGSQVVGLGLDGWDLDDDARLTSAWQNRIEAMQAAAEAGHVRPAKAVA